MRAEAPFAAEYSGGGPHLERANQAQAGQTISLGSADLRIRGGQFAFAGRQVRALAQQVGRYFPNIQQRRLRQSRRIMAEHFPYLILVAAGQLHQALEQHIALALLFDEGRITGCRTGVAQR